MRRLSQLRDRRAEAPIPRVNPQDLFDDIENVYKAFNKSVHGMNRAVRAKTIVEAVNTRGHDMVTSQVYNTWNESIELLERIVVVREKWVDIQEYMYGDPDYS